MRCARTLGEIIEMVRNACVEIPLHVVLAISRGLCDALVHIHERRAQDAPWQGVVIDLDHVAVTASGEVELVEPCGERRSGSAYLSPEAIRNESVDARSDLFAVGVVIWELLAGRTLFVAAIDLWTVQNVLRGQIASPTLWRPDCPHELETVVASLLARDPDLRPASATVLRTQLDAVIRGHATHAAAVDSTQVATWLASVPPAVVPTLHPDDVTTRHASLELESTKRPVVAPPAASSAMPAAQPIVSRGSRIFRIVLALSAISIGALGTGALAAFVTHPRGRGTRTTAESPPTHRVMPVYGAPPPTSEQPPVVAPPPPRSTQPASRLIRRGVRGGERSRREEVAE